MTSDRQQTGRCSGLAEVFMKRIWVWLAAEMTEFDNAVEEPFDTPGLWLHDRTGSLRRGQAGQLSRGKHRFSSHHPASPLSRLPVSHHPLPADRTNTVYASVCVFKHERLMEVFEGLFQKPDHVWQLTSAADSWADLLFYMEKRKKVGNPKVSLTSDSVWGFFMMKNPLCFTAFILAIILKFDFLLQ